MTQASTPHAPSRTLSQRVVAEIAADIRAGVLKPGDRVPTEPELSQRFGVSRTVVRESMSRLQASGLVETRHGIGTFVLAPAEPGPALVEPGTQMTVLDLLAMLELRINLEAAGAGLAAARRSDAQLAALRATLDEFAAANAAGASTNQADFQFHLQVAQATGNRYFEEVLRTLGKATISFPRALLGVRPDATHAEPSPDPEPAMPAAPQFGESTGRLMSDKSLTIAEHESIYDAIRRGDAEAASSAMFLHLSNSRERLRRIIGQA